MQKYLYAICIAAIFGGCSITDNDQPIPAYLTINDVTVFTTDNQGAPTHNISDVWVYADNELIGVFEVPAKIPILVKNTTTNFSIYPGIRNNGEKSRSFIYLLMEPENFTLSIAEGEEIEKSLNFQYTENTKFDFVEGFEGAGHIFTLDRDENSETLITSSSEEAISGSKSGKIALDNTNPFISVATIFNYQRSGNAGRDSYLEMDYKCDVPFFVGVIYVQEGQEVEQPLLAINPKEDWNKIYVDFTEVLTSPVLENYRIYFTTDLEPLTASTGTIYLDNLKFVHF